MSHSAAGVEPEKQTTIKKVIVFLPNVSVGRLIMGIAKKRIF
jgi:hypothetical protein